MDFLLQGQQHGRSEQNKFQNVLFVPNSSSIQQQNDQFKIAKARKLTNFDPDQDDFEFEER